MVNSEPEKFDSHNNFNNTNYHTGYNENYRGYNPNHHRGFSPNYPIDYNGYVPHKIPADPIEIKWIKYAEDYFRDNFANVEGIIETVRSVAFMLQNTYTNMICIFQASLGVINNGKNFQNTFKSIYKLVQLYKFFRWLYVTFLKLLGCNVPLHQEGDANATEKPTTPEGSYKILVFLGVIISAPCLISKFFNSENKEAVNLEYWRSSGYSVKVIKDFNSSTPNEMSVRVNDKLVVAPKYIQSEMKLDNSEFVFASSNHSSGLVPVKHLMIDQP